MPVYHNPKKKKKELHTLLTETVSGLQINPLSLQYSRNCHNRYAFVQLCWEMNAIRGQGHSLESVFQKWTDRTEKCFFLALAWWKNVNFLVFLSPIDSLPWITALVS